MFRTVKFESITQLKKNKNPLIIFALTEESEAIAFACKENGINVSAFCDNEIRKTGKKLHDIEIIYTPDLPEKYPNASFLIAHHTLDDCAEQLSDLGYDDFYSPLELFKNYKVENYSYRTSTEYMRKKIENAMILNKDLSSESISCTYL